VVTHTTSCETCGRPCTGARLEGLCEVCLLEFGWRGFADADDPAGAEAPAAQGLDSVMAWRRVGDYELLSEIGRGGMGVVYRARQVSLDRVVALKMILVGHWASQAQVQRFKLEARASASLDHPHIVPILELGEHEGWHYFSMKLVEGEDLADQTESGLWPAECRVDQERVARLMRIIAGAVHFAHERGILHRDLKPPNILVDRQGTPYVTDFGLAKLLEETSDLTRTSAVLGTPAYMAPEQAAGRAEAVTAAADLYSLGAILYQLLTGSPVHPGRTPLEIVRRILETEVTPPQNLNPRVDPDLSTVCLRCLQREPSARYSSAAELADDLGRWLRHEPIEARPVTTLERLDYWRRRNPMAAILSSLLLLTLLATGFVSSGLAWLMREARDDARRIATENQNRMIQLLVQNGVRAAETGDPLASLPWLVAALREDEGVAQREHAHRTRIGSLLEHAPELKALWFHERLIQHAAFSNDGGRVATASYDGSVRVWDTASGGEIGAARWHTNHEAGMTLLFHVAFSPDGSRLVSAGNRDARVWDVLSGDELADPLVHDNEVRLAAFSPNGKWIMTASLDLTVRCWDAITGVPIFPPLAHPAGVLTAAWSPNNDRIASGGRDRILRVWEATTGRLLLSTPAHEEEITHVEFSPDGHYFVSACRSAQVRVWRSADGRLVAALPHDGGVRLARFSPDGARLITGGSDRQARIWDWQSGTVTMSVPHRFGDVDWVGWSNTGQQVFTAGGSRIQLWHPVTGQPLTPPLPHPHTICHAGISPDGLSLLTAGADGTGRLWRLPRPPEPSTATVTASPASLIPALPCTLSDPPNRLAIHRDGQITLYELRRAQADPAMTSIEGVRRLGAWPAPEGCALHLSADGSLIALQTSREVQLLDAITGEPRAPALTYQGGIRHLALDSTGRRLLIASHDGSAQVWKVQDGRLLVGPLRHDDVIIFGSFTPDDRRIVTTGYDGTARVWDAASGRRLVEPLRHGSPVLSATFSPGQDRLATLTDGNRVRVWELDSGRALTPPLLHHTEVRYLAFLHTSGPLLTVTHDLRFQLWELPSGQPLNLNGLPLDPKSGTNLLPATDLTQDWLRSLPVDPRPTEELERLSTLLSGFEVDGEGGLVPVDLARLRQAWTDRVGREKIPGQEPSPDDRDQKLILATGPAGIPALEETHPPHQIPCNHSLQMFQAYVKSLYEVESP